jgi:hypothetical protein
MINIVSDKKCNHLTYTNLNNRQRRYKMKVCKIKWSSDYDETKIIFDDDFYESDRITKLDILQDAIAILEEKYNSILINQYLR